ncbi:MAG: 4-phosphoerythronate dehydrogenase [Moraxella sp.]|nr:4-phosphoerythronate dehydrogenase [Moraxella sp.]
MFTVLADENIAHLDDYFVLHDNIRLIKQKGRDINQQSINNYKPHALFIRSVTPIHADNIQDFGNITFIGTATIGIDHVDTHYLQQNNIHFANAKGCSRHSVAQYVLTAIFNINPVTIHQSITLGIIGLGNIGNTLARYAKDLGWHILGYDPYLPNSDMNNSDLDTLLKNSDVISVHTPLTKTGKYPTYQMLNVDKLDKLKNGAILINSARGEIINQQDLLNAIDNQNLQVVLDVFPDEPTIDKTLLDKLTIATPHIAGYTLEGKLRGTDMIYQAFCQKFDLPILQSMDKILPPNSYAWQSLKQHLLDNDLSILPAYYHIMQDDNSLRTVCDNHGVMGDKFDQLRKTYTLKREWQFHDG